MGWFGIPVERNTFFSASKQEFSSNAKFENDVESEATNLMNYQDVDLNEEEKEASTSDCPTNPKASEDLENVSQGQGGAIPKKKQQVK